jgi:hypothetical protein
MHSLVFSLGGWCGVWNTTHSPRQKILACEANFIYLCNGYTGLLTKARPLIGGDSRKPVPITLNGTHEWIQYKSAC